MKKTLKPYLIALLVGFAMAGAILWSKDLFSQTDPKVIFHILCDAFFVAGVVITSAGLLVFSSNEGTFDGLVYGVSSFINMFRPKHKKKYDTFFDYRVARADKKFSFGFLLICGLFFLAVSLVMYFLYRRYV
ncbi:MAG: DUF3899 domain-containing protein [Clostridia bacterium]|nr:DUF3899 domain-containing protein [Clostridia bacterium]